jgi:hypothetical protein
MASELFRVYQPATPGNGSANAVFVASATLSDTRLTEQQIDGLREQLALRERERGQLL